jgi:two-component system cell cycle response regulator DivK
MTTVLLADDQLELRSIHSAYLQSHGFRVLTADDGLTALEVARTHHPDIIVLDHTMPRRNGIDVARELQQRRDTASIPIIMLTAHTYGAVGRKAREAGCVSVLNKPCPPSRVLHEIGLHIVTAARPDAAVSPDAARPAPAEEQPPGPRATSSFRTRRYGR